MVSQLRIYTINKGKLDAFVKAWREGVYPLRLKQGFKIDSAWIIEDQNEFIWILTYDGPQDWQTKEDEYYSSTERKALDPDPAQYIAKIEKWFMTPVRLG